MGSIGKQSNLMPKSKKMTIKSVSKYDTDCSKMEHLFNIILTIVKSDLYQNMIQSVSKYDTDPRDLYQNMTTQNKFLNKYLNNTRARPRARGHTPAHPRARARGRGMIFNHFFRSRKKPKTKKKGK